LPRPTSRGIAMLSMNVLYVIHYPFFGGPQNQALRTVGPLAARGVDTVVVLPDEPGNAADRLRDAGIEVIALQLHRLRAIPDPLVQVRFLGSIAREVAALRRLIRERSIDVVQVGGLVNPHAAIAARLEGVGVVWQLLDTRSPMALRRLLMPWVLMLADVVMTTGVGIARVHPGAMNLGARLVPFYPPVDTSVFRPDQGRRADARDALRIPPGAPLVGTVANLTPQKGLEHFVTAADALHNRRPDVRFVILGSSMETQGRYEAAIRRMAQESAVGRAGALRVLDPGIRVSELLPALDLFMLTSVPHSEGVSTTVLEAMASGIPVVSTDVGALSEVVADGVTGRIVTPLDDGAMVEAVAALLDDVETRARMGTAARQRATERYSVESCVDTHLRAYRIAAARVGRRRRQGAWGRGR
jgi:glycosyltransferase involved in cell wall biosynthesis